MRAISSRMKFIQQGLYFPWFLKRTTTSSKNIIKNKIGIAIKFCKCYVIKRSPSNFSNKTQLKNYFFKLGRTRFNAFSFGPDLVWPETLLHCSREQWRVTPYSSRELWSCTLHYSLMWTVKSATLHLTKTQQ